MGLFDRIFAGKNIAKKGPDEQTEIEAKTKENSDAIGDFGKVTVLSGNVGSSTGSALTDFYVYEWFIKETGEVFYIGKGRGARYKVNHGDNSAAEKIRKQYETDIRFVAQNLTEEQALKIETEEMTRILNETTDRLTNRIIPFFTKRDNGYSRSINTPPLKFETAPVLYASEIDEHYFQIMYRPFDMVEYANLNHPVFIDNSLSGEVIGTVYGGNYEKYYNEVVALLEQNGNRIIKTKYAKSVTAWIYTCDDSVTNYDLDETTAEEKIGRRIPAYHLIDVWKFLKEQFGGIEVGKLVPVKTNPVHNRIPLDNIKNINNWDAGFKAGYKYWEDGDAERKAGNIEKAIRLFDEARFNGYFAPVLYRSYAMAYRKLKDLDNEIDILEEAIERYRAETGDYSQLILMFEEQRKNAIAKLKNKNGTK